MWDRVTWLFLWITLAFWAGCASTGDDQNYKINNDPHPIFKENPDLSAFPVIAPTANANEKDAPSLKAGSRAHWPKYIVRSKSGQVKHHPVYFAGSDWRMMDIEKIEPKNWRKGTIKTASYFRFREPRPAALAPPNVVTTVDAMEMRVVRVLGNNRYRPDSRDSAELIVLPMKFMYDIAVWPARMLVEPPTSEKISPTD